MWAHDRAADNLAQVSVIVESRVLIEEKRGPRSPLALALLSMAVGMFAGLLGAIFRLGLQRADAMRTFLIGTAHGWGPVGFVVVVGGIAFATGTAAWLVRRFAPDTSGSGIPHVESQLKVGFSGNPIAIVVVKFVGGLLAIGSGLALGREGPTVQIGAGVGHLIGRAFRRNENESRVLLAAGAGAGLATAFNAPIAGGVFVLEELVGGFDLPVTIATLGASTGAIAVSRVLLGQAPDFVTPHFGYPEFGTVPVSLVVGIAMGLLGVLYNRTLLGGLVLTAQMKKIGVEWRAAIIGAVVAVLGWFAPSMIGGGDNLTQGVLEGNLVMGALGIAFLIRFLLGPISYAARVPGGLFAPMLTLGSQGGLFLAMLLFRLYPSHKALPQEFAVVGMAAFFAAVVRAPITGIILAIELTGSFSMFLPMLGASFAAMAVATILKDPPIYDSLNEIH